MDLSNYHLFWKRTKLSQWARTPFIEGKPPYIDAVTFLTAEHYMMYHKAELFNDNASSYAILATRSPKEAKRLGGLVKNFNQEKWNESKFDIVVNGNILKFLQNKDARDELMSTGEKILVEACPYDRIWGIGMTSEDPNISNQSLWGENLLGKALVRVRSHIRKLSGI